MKEYETWTEEYTHLGRKLSKRKFECDCGRELVVETAECDQCGAHYTTDINDDVVQVAPPIGTGGSDSTQSSQSRPDSQGESGGASA